MLTAGFKGLSKIIKIKSMLLLLLLFQNKEKLVRMVDQNGGKFERFQKILKNCILSKSIFFFRRSSLGDIYIKYFDVKYLTPEKGLPANKLLCLNNVFFVSKHIDTFVVAVSYLTQQGHLPCSLAQLCSSEHSFNGHATKYQEQANT